MKPLLSYLFYVVAPAWIPSVWKPPCASSVDEYVFRKSYYFVGGDNVLYSQDSRYWAAIE